MMSLDCSLDSRKNNQNRAQLLAFLCSTNRKKKPVGKLRGLDHILKMIWVMVCEEWWELHVERLPPACIDPALKLPEITQPWQQPTGPRRVHNVPESYMDYPKVRQQCAGCPVAVVANGVQFPPLSAVPLNTFAHQETEDLYVNMMPFDISRIDSLPECCRQYWPLINICRRLTSSICSIGYLTIDERPVSAGQSQRRAGLHVESPGVLPLFNGSDPSDPEHHPEVPGSRFVPGAEHRWGGGMMMRWERVKGGIFMASNVANTTAVWNCQIHDENGDFIGPHGDIERFRELLGPCARTLEAGELIWMTDRTPHESLLVPLQPDGNPARRQYFRLVIGTVTAWYADHSTPNPLGYAPPSCVNIMHGNKFSLHPKRQISWYGGTTAELQAGRELRRFRVLLYECGLGHLFERFQQYGVRSLADLVWLHTLQVIDAIGANYTEDDANSQYSQKSQEVGRDVGIEDYPYDVWWGEDYSADGKGLFYYECSEGSNYYEIPRITAIVKRAKQLLPIASNPCV